MKSQRMVTRMETFVLTEAKAEMVSLGRTMMVIIFVHLLEKMVNWQ